MPQIQATIHGQVQGVGFRYNTLQIAQNLGLTGFVRNLADGTVEIVAEGSDDQLNALIEWAHRGPSAAQVTQVDVVKSADQSRFDRFTIER
jgi:acylphosphatase